ncbi:MAG: UbiA-like polyprenyltransferase [Phycisphaerales bacterium]
MDPTATSAQRVPGSEPARALGAVVEIAQDIKLSHSVFALPFAVLGAAWAGVEGGVARGQFALSLSLVVGCMVSARSAAMLANRILDREIDARNPRTAGRAIPAGRLALATAVRWYALLALLFVACCALFGALQGNWWPLALSLPVLAWVSLYGLVKRFSMLCHLWLGVGLAISPVAAALAVHPAAALHAAPWLMAGLVACWVAGFDILYAMQDLEVDRRDGLHSIPSRLGPAGAAWTARALHVAALALLVALWRTVPAFGAGFGAAVALTVVVIVGEHVLLATGGAPRFAKHFTTLNGCISLAIGAAGTASLWMHATAAGG